MNLKSIIKDSITLKNGEDADSGKILGIALILVFIGLSIYSYIVLKQAFDPISWGTGAGGTMAGIGAHLKLKQGTEPE